MCDKIAGRVKMMKDNDDRIVKKAGPAHPVIMFGFKELPAPGADVVVFPSAAKAKKMEAKFAKQTIGLREDGLLDILLPQETAKQGSDLNDLDASDEGKEPSEPEIPVAKIILKVDSAGVITPIVNSINDLNRSPKVQVEVIASSVGEVQLADIERAKIANSAIFVFGEKKLSNAISRHADREGVEIFQHSVIYQLIDAVMDAMLDKLPPLLETKVVAEAKVLRIFQITIHKSEVPIAGCKVTSGTFLKRNQARVLRRTESSHAPEVLSKTSVSTLKRYKDDVRQVETGLECGIQLKDFHTFKEGDIIQSIEEKEIPKPHSFLFENT